MSNKQRYQRSTMPAMFQCNLHLLIVLALYVPAVYCFHHCDEFTVTEAENWLTLHHVYDNRSAALPVLGEILAARDHPTIHTRLTDQNRCSAVSLTGPGRLDGQWYSIQTPEPHLVFEPQSCQLRRLSAASARHCLDGKYIVFIGDSLTRYQYLSFAYFLSHMKHLPRYHGLQTPHLNDVRDWKRGWNQFMLEGSKQLMDVRTRACGSESRDQRSTQDAAPGASVHELCDCNREETNETARSGQGFREFRRLCIAANSPAERACFDTDRLGPGTLKVGYQQAMGHPTWYQAPLESLRALLSERPLPDVVVVNAGLWAPQGQYTTPEGPELALQHYRVLLGGASAMAAEAGVKLLWKSTTTYDTVTTSSRVLHEAALQAAAEFGVPVYDVHSFGLNAIRDGFARKMYFDRSLHYWAFVYQELNDILLNTLCDEGCAWHQDK